jgi:hypothetical protein
MNNLNQVCLTSPLHDPEGRITEIFEKYSSELLRLYNGFVAINVTETTSPKTLEAIRKTKIKFSIQDKKNVKNIGDNYKNALSLGLDFPSSHFHLMDFDRALHWTKRFPRELRKVIGKMSSYEGLLSFIRTKRAFESHPFIQRSTEIVTNALASKVVGFDVDIMSGSFGLDKNFANLVLQNSKEKGVGIYAEILKIALKNEIPIKTIIVEGLEWETPDQYQNEIGKDGYIAWLKKFESLTEWKRRIALIEESTKVLIP